LNIFLKKNRALALVAVAQCAICFIAATSPAEGLAQVATGRVTAPAASLPNLGDGSDMTPGSERTLGDRIARELYRDADYVDDAVLMEYVQGIWQPLLAAAT
jgi:predicted Zn-dependent protease